MKFQIFLDAGVSRRFFIERDGLGAKSHIRSIILTVPKTYRTDGQLQMSFKKGHIYLSLLAYFAEYELTNIAKRISFPCL